jgi:hypothetical protein
MDARSGARLLWLDLVAGKSVRRCCHSRCARGDPKGIRRRSLNPLSFWMMHEQD